MCRSSSSTSAGREKHTRYLEGRHPSPLGLRPRVEKPMRFWPGSGVRAVFACRVEMRSLVDACIEDDEFEHIEIVRGQLTVAARLLQGDLVQVVSQYSRALARNRSGSTPIATRWSSSSLSSPSSSSMSV